MREIGWAKEEQIRQRIACPELGYPVSEARYATIQDWEAATGKDWGVYIAELAPTRGPWYEGDRSDFSFVDNFSGDSRSC